MINLLHYMFQKRFDPSTGFFFVRLFCRFHSFSRCFFEVNLLIPKFDVKKA